MYWKLFIVFACFVLADLLGHKLFKIKRKAFEWILLLTVVAGTVVFSVFTIRSFGKNGGSEDFDLYRAYRYISDGDSDVAVRVLDQLERSGADKDSIYAMRAFAAAGSGDYLNGYFKAVQILERDDLDETLRKSMMKLRDICREQIGLGGAVLTADAYDYDFDQYVTAITADPGSQTSTGPENAASYEVDQLMKEYVGTLDFSAEEKEFSDRYTIDRWVEGKSPETMDIYRLEQFEDKYGTSEDILKLKSKYYVDIHDYLSAKEAAKELINFADTPANTIILTDIIADEVHSREEDVVRYYEGKLGKDVWGGDDSSYDPYGTEYGGYDNSRSDGWLDEEDEEISALLKAADQKFREANEKDRNYGSDAAKDIEELREAGRELVRKANRIEAERAINFILARDPDGTDDTGIYRLEMAKLYVATGNKEKAEEYIYKLITSGQAVREDSLIRDELEKVIAEYKMMDSETGTPGFLRAITQLITRHSQNIVENREGTINGEFSDYMEETLIYSKIYVHVSRVDATSYPEITAYVNISGKKKDYEAEELVSDFKKEDFTLVDTEYQISDFELVTNEAAKQINIALVMDKSGSMKGSALDNAISAANALVDQMNTDTQKISVVAYDSSAASYADLTSSREELRTAIGGIHASGGTNIGSGLTLGMEQLSGASGMGAVILMSDGKDGGKWETIAACIEQAKATGVSIYTVCFGSDADVDLMSRIAESSGGKMIVADSENLANIYLTLQKYIVNNYCFKYTVTANPERNSRNLEVILPQYSTYEVRDYHVGDADAEYTGEEAANDGTIFGIGQKTIGIATIAPSSISAKAAQEGVTMELTGNGLEDISSIEIGSVKLSDIKAGEDGKITAVLKGTVPVGSHDIRISTNDGRYAHSRIRFRVFDGGTTKSVKIGHTLIMADEIGRADDNELVASGNVLINNFLHFSGDLSIYSYDIPANIENTPMLDLGQYGTLSGDGRLYLNCGQDAETTGFAGENLSGDFVIRDGAVSIEVSEDHAYFNLSGGDELIPGVLKNATGEVTLYPGYLKCKVTWADLSPMLDSIRQSLTGGALRYTGQAMAEMDLTLIATYGSVEFGGSYQCEDQNAVFEISRGLKIRGFSGTMNSLDKEKRIWSLNTKIEQESMGADQDSEATESRVWALSIGSKGLTADTVELSVGTEAYSFYDTIYMKNATGKIDGLSSRAADAGDVVISANIELEMKPADKDACVVYKSLKDVLGTGKSDAAELRVNLSDFRIDVKAAMDVPGSEGAEVQIGIDGSSLRIERKGDYDIQFLGGHMTGKGEVVYTSERVSDGWFRKYKVRTDQGSLTGPGVNSKHDGAYSYEFWNEPGQQDGYAWMKYGKTDRGVYFNSDGTPNLN